MSSLNETPASNRTHIAFFGLRNAGKSTLVNEFTGQSLSIVSDTPGTTTDPVSKAMEILPLGPCVVTDTAGLDDEGELGRKRVERTLEILATVDIAVWVDGGAEDKNKTELKLRDECALRGVFFLRFKRGDSVEELKKAIGQLKNAGEEISLLEGLVKAGDKVLCICPIDASAPKGRLILPQVQVIRECLDRHALCTVSQLEDIPDGDFDLVVTDSQAFFAVKGKFKKLTSFSVLFARQKGDLAYFTAGIEAVKSLKDGDRVLIAEGCTHHRQCNDIGKVKIPAALKKICGKELEFVFSSGKCFDHDLGSIKLIVHCGGCMLTRREMLRRIELAKASGVKMVNYGLLLAAACGMKAEDIAI